MKIPVRRCAPYTFALLFQAIACSSATSDDGTLASAGASARGGASAGSASGGTNAGGAGGGTNAGGGANAGGASGSAGAPSAGSGGSPEQAGAGGSVAGAGGGSAAGEPFKGVANSPCAARSALNVAWYYNWTQKESEPCSDGKGGEFVPMIWGHTGAEQTAASIQSAITGFVGKGYKNVLGFNEPDNTTQSNIASATAISLLTSFDNAAIKVGTPATQANATGQAWFKDYMAKLTSNVSLRADFIALHWYGWNAGSCDANASQLESYLKYAEGFAGNRPIWLTEWSCLNQSAPTPEGVLAFYKGALAVFAKHPRVQRYAWYPWTTNCELNDEAGALTPLGVAYAAAPALKNAP